MEPTIVMFVKSGQDSLFCIEICYFNCCKQTHCVTKNLFLTFNSFLNNIYFSATGPTNSKSTKKIIISSLSNLMLLKRIYSINSI